MTTLKTECKTLDRMNKRLETITKLLILKNLRGYSFEEQTDKLNEFGILQPFQKEFFH